MENSHQFYAQHVSAKLKTYLDAMETAGFRRLIIGSGSQGFRFRDDLFTAYFPNAYFSEFVELKQYPSSFLVIEEGLTPVLFIQQHDDFWHSEPEPIDARAIQAFDVRGYKHQPDIRHQDKTAYIGADTANLSDSLASDLSLNPEPLLAYIDYHRAWKTEHEKSCLRRANQIAVQAHRAAEEMFLKDGSEYDIHMAYLQAIKNRDSDLPYDSIVALNEHAAVLHHMHLSTAKPAKSHSLLIDAGASYQGYGADISRTYGYDRSGACEQSSDFLALIQGVDQLQQQIVMQSVAGKPYIELHELAHRLIARLLSAMGIVRCSADQALDSGLTHVFFPHGVGHLLGVQVHDKGGHMIAPDDSLQKRSEKYPALRLTRTLEENMVFTIEPGVYFIPSLLSKWQNKAVLNQPLINTLMPFGGVRIEDNIISGKASVENLTGDAFAACNQI